MKRPIFQYNTILAVTFVAMASCATADGPDTKGDASPLVFTAGEVSRAFTGNDNIIYNPFAVWGHFVPTGSVDASPVTVFNGTEVYYTKGNGWHYENTQYWFPGYSYSFAALHPASYIASKAVTYNGGALTVTGIKPGVDGIDLLAATASRDCVAGQTMRPVTLNFSHQLSLLAFNGRLAADADKDVEVIAARLYGVPSVGDWSDGQWVSLRETTTAASPYREAASKVFAIDDEASYKGVDIFGDMFVIPQFVSADAVFEIEYRYVGVPGDIHVHRVPLSSVSTAIDGRWRPNRSYRYNFTIDAGADYILFDTPMVDQWEEGGGGNIIIQ